MPIILERGNKMDTAVAIGVGAGLAVGIPWGIYSGEFLCNNVELLKQAPDAIRYIVDAGAAGLLGSFCAGIGGILTENPREYKFFKKL